MKYTLSKPIDKQKFKELCNRLYEDGAYVELRKINQNRSISQNSYLHLLIGWFALEYGESTEYIKEEIFKKTVNKELFLGEFVNRKTGEVRTDWRSSAALSTKEMTLAIDRFRDYSSKEAGIYLPEANERQYLHQIEQDMDKAKQYL